MFDQTLALSQFLVAVATLVTLVWGLVRMFQSARLSIEAREHAVKAANHAARAADLAHAAAAAAHDDIKGVAENMLKIELASNSMKDALVAATEKEAFARGMKTEKEKDKERP